MGKRIGKNLKRNIDKNKKKGVGLSMSRVPYNTKKDFIELAEEEFADDYGACFNWLFHQAMEYQGMKYRLIDLGSINQRVNDIEEKLNRLLDGLRRKKEDTDADTALDGTKFKQK